MQPLSPALKNKTFLDLLERTGATFAQAFLAVQIADQGKVDQVTSLKVAAVAGALAVAKYLLVKVNTFLGTP